MDVKKVMKKIIENKNSVRDIILEDEKAVPVAVAQDPNLDTKQTSAPEVGSMDEIDVEDFLILKDMHEENLGQKFTDEQFKVILKKMENTQPGVIKRMADLNISLLGLLIAMDDATDR